MQEAMYSVCFTQGKPPLVTVRADSAAEWVTNLNEAAKSGALNAIKQIGDTLNGLPPTTQAAPGGIQASQGQPSVPTATAAGQNGPAQELPAGFASPKCETCGGGTSLAKEGISSKSGKPYKRWACDANQLHPATFTS
jgi:hypothetical protein